MDNMTLTSPQQAAQDLQFLSLPEAAKLLPTQNGKRISTATLWRWCVKGTNGVKLRHSRFGKRIAVTLPDLIEFGAAVAEAHTTDQATSTAPTRTRHKSSQVPRTEDQRKAAAAAAMSELRTAGLA